MSRDVNPDQVGAAITVVEGLQPTDADTHVARAFHDTYEELAPQFGYKTRKESAVPWERVPKNNRDLMVATVTALRARGVIHEGPPINLGPQDPALPQGKEQEDGTQDAE